MIIDIRTLPTNSDIRCDLCIIGAGAAGITIAQKFIGSSVNVIMLESGGLRYDERTQELYRVGIPAFPIMTSNLPV